MSASSTSCSVCSPSGTSRLKRGSGGRGIVPGDVYLELRKRLGTGEDRVWQGILVTPRARRVVERAGQLLAPEAMIEPIDLFEAICLEEGGLTADLSFRRAFNGAGAV